MTLAFRFGRLTCLGVILALASCASPSPAPPEEDSSAPVAAAVIGFTLIDADRNQPVAGYDPLQDGARLDLAALPSNLNLRANTRPERVGSVRFAWGDHHRTDDAAPYALADDRAGDYDAWTLPLGSHTVTATPYRHSGARGEAGTALTVSFEIIDGSSEPAPEPPVQPPSPPEPPPPAAERQQLKYVIVDDGVEIYDMSDDYRLLRTVGVPTEHGMRRIRGVSAHAGTARLYVSYWGDAPRRGLGYLLAYDLHSDEVVWVNTYEPSIDSPEVSPDGQTIYMGCGEERADCDWWFVLDAATGEVESKIPVFIGPHNTIVGSSGERVYLASLKHNYLSIADTRTNKVIQKVGPFGASIRPFTINESESLTFVTVDHLSGFEIGDLKTGEQLYRVEVKGFPWEQTPTLGHQSHGIALTPDEREVWVVDGYNRYLHVFDVTGLPTEAPRQIASIALRGLPKWINFSRDGRFAHVSSGEIVEAATREIVTRVSESRYFVQIDFENGLPVQAYSRYGLGYGEAGVDQATD